MEVHCMSSKKQQGPLLYIYQPFSRTPSKINMQEVYTNRQETEPPKEEKQIGEEVNKKISLAKKEVLLEPIPIKVTKSENQQTTSSAPQYDRQRPSFSRVKPFKELNLMERLDYLINFPKVLPPVPCVFYTANKNYQGYLIEYTDQQVTIQFHDQNTETIALDELKDIIMIGIKK